MTFPDSSAAASRAPVGLAAVLFDMDGTLIDSERLWAEAEKEVVAELGGVWTEQDHHRNIGGSAEKVSRYMIELAGADLPPGEVTAMLGAAFERRLASRPPLRPGAAELVAEVAGSPVPAALVTSTWRRMVEPAIARLGLEHFDAVVAGDEVARNKPHPDPYLRAARLLGVEPERCVAIEDSEVGVASAQAAGCVTLAVPNMVAIAPEPGRIVVDSLAGVDLARLRAMAA